MRLNRILILGGILVCAIPASACAQGGIRWLEDPYQARQIAMTEQRLILLHFYTDWCAPCRNLDREVFPQPEVQRAISTNYIPVKVNAERYKEIARYYRVDRYPTDVIVDANGKEVFRSVTPQDPVRYVQMLDGVAGDYRAAGPAYGNVARNAGGPRPAAGRRGTRAAAGRSGRDASQCLAGLCRQSSGGQPSRRPRPVTPTRIPIRTPGPPAAPNPSAARSRPLRPGLRRRLSAVPPADGELRRRSGAQSAPRRRLLRSRRGPGSSRRGPPPLRRRSAIGLSATPCLPATRASRLWPWTDSAP